MPRPSKYDSHVLPKIKLVEAWARDGLTLDQIASNLRISTVSIHEYKKRYPLFANILKRGKEEADIEVENALYKRAIGYRYDEVTYETRIHPVTEERVSVETKRITKEMTPDVTAQIFWLKNRRAELWRNRAGPDSALAEEHLRLQNELLRVQIAAAAGMPAEGEADDGFLDALKSEGETVWDGDEDGQEE
jgi:hypothetical protein